MTISPESSDSQSDPTQTEPTVHISMECRRCGEKLETSRGEWAIAFTHEHKTLHLIMPGVSYECPQCGYTSEWTDGLSVASGDDHDEFWCQVCGAETVMQS